MKKIVIAVDSFKRSLSSITIADAIEEGISSVLPNCQIIKLPIADGGEGTTEALVNATNGRFITVTVSNPLQQPINAQYGILGDEQTAVIEMAAASGLNLIPFKQGNVLHTTTFGTGELIVDAIRKGCRNFILGIGGSATNEAGLGMLQALGFRFPDKNGKEIIPTGKTLADIDHIHTTNQLPELSVCNFKVATDVKNPFCGTNGAARIFGPQKGGSPEDIELLEKGMCHISKLFQSMGKDITGIPGTGAGGGIAGGCLAFLNAQLLPGIEIVKDALHFDSLIKDADLVITGEGKIDYQTLEGKAPWGIAQSCIRQNIPVVALAGRIEGDKNIFLQAGFTEVLSINPSHVPLEKAMQPEYTYCNLKKTASTLIRSFSA